ncbi:hypothetical protein QFZ94_001271 [Paraburkholderia sp. JPY465]
MRSSSPVGKKAGSSTTARISKRSTAFDLPVVGRLFEEYVASHGLQERLHFYPGDFFKNSCPAADVLVMGHILHDWDLGQKLELLAKCYASLPPGGCREIRKHSQRARAT